MFLFRRVRDASRDVVSPAARPWSLRTRLTLWLLLAVVATALIQGATTWHTASTETEALFDAQMERTALSLTGGLIAGVLGQESPSYTPNTPELIIQIWRSDGVMLYRSPSRTLLPPVSVIGFSRVEADGTPYRVYTLPTRTQVIQVAQDEAARRRAVAALALRASLPVVALAPLLMLIVWWVVGRSVAPVERLRRALAGRATGDLQPLPLAGLPAEVRPLVIAVNDLLTRLAAAWHALGEFTADAAHELRSPLAALRLQVQSLQRAPDEEARALAERRLLTGVDRATQLVEQLLVLAREEGAPAQGAEQESDLVQLAQAEVDQAQLAATAAGVILECECGEFPHCVVAGRPDAIALALRNLIANAVRYARGAGHVRVLIAPWGELGAELRVEDSGPGVAEEDCKRIWDRFYRAPDAVGQGSGLGLAIVATIARRVGAELAVERSAALGGAAFSVRWMHADHAESPAGPTSLG